MRIGKWMLALVAILACGLIAVGCGDDEEGSSSGEPATEQATSEDTSSEDASSEDTSSDSAVDVDEFLSSCQEAFEGQPGEDIAADGCQQAADALEQCAQEAEAAGDETAAELAVEACQETADQAVAALEATAGGG